MPRSPEQFEEIREKSRKKITSAALDLFANKGYGSTSIDSIAKKAGVSKGLIYNYFENKRSILFAIYDDAMSQGDQVLLRHKGNTDPHARITALINEVFGMMTNKQSHFKLLMVLSLQPGVVKETKDFAKKAFKRNAAMIEAFSGEIKSTDPIKGLLLDALIDGIMINYMRYGDVYPLDALKERLLLDYATPKAKLKRTVKDKT